jgi:hypothetical protein
MPLSIERARKDAKALCDAWRKGDKAALRRVTRYFATDETPQLAKAQLVVARENMYASWAELIRLDGVTQNDLILAARAGDVPRTRELLAVMKPAWHAAVGICINPLYGPEDRVVECLRLLFDAGADPNAGVLRKGVKYSCLYGALEQGNEGVATLLRERGGVLLPATEP